VFPLYFDLSERFGQQVDQVQRISIPDYFGLVITDWVAMSLKRCDGTFRIPSVARTAVIGLSRIVVCDIYTDTQQEQTETERESCSSRVYPSAQWSQ